ncbi:MAG: Lipid A export ATP-binding/permease protein MsbA [Alphaproteobacteria bacterium MarineAlpha5_Bin8]|nr:MAG: Lipid A export ATP-binding/permease protein MsbA [Alphaproteobacteria bacterium MarineAlpha5_Bin7]PPR46890.1 MAG: Lipid A export ATP-binding/permease protein MsbA [Alphaproteobacteria bacterium MarineAlpha5_Bin8]PPR54675.1 MAG: Lipid A export ATP-binding/permease protein MsbA [Alphaproteobacteria bacterium MarineAlpha5_Bin6]|tara:strand:- start:2741 stop:4498 length:1758 start_codon:yes stop_codon:yes gene_type:complete
MSKKININKKVVKRLINNYILNYKLNILFALLMMMVSAGATGLHAWLVRPALDEVLIKGDKQMLLIIPLAIILTTLCKGVATYLHSFQMSKVAHNIISTLQSQMFEKLMYLNIKFYNDSKSGNLISRLINDTYFLRMAIVKTVTGVIKDVLVIIFLLGNMFYQSWELTIFAFFAFPLALWPIKKIGKSIRKITYTIQNEIAKFSNVLGESIRGIRQVKAYNRENFEKNKAINTINQIKNYFIKSAFISNRLSPIMEFIGSLAIAISIYIGGTFVLNETMTTGQFMSFLVSLLLAYQPVKALGNLNISVQEGLAGAERIFQLMDDGENSLERKNNNNNIKITKGKLEIKNISFSYQDKNILNDLSMIIPAGKQVGLVGLSGSGKSTIINLLLQFFENYKGQILIDDQDISIFSIESIRKNIGLVTQDTVLFNDTIESNIKYGNLNASKDEIENAANQAGVLEFVNSLPKKLQTIVGESGIKLSGGQKQRIAIARALLKNAPILLLDEATSSLDNLTERKVQESINELMKDRTSLIIAHRLSTIKKADLIYVLDKGKIIDSGSHEELIDSCDLYSQLNLKEKLENAN